MNVLIHKNKKLENGILRILFSFHFLAKNHRPVSCYFFSQVFSPKQKSCHKYINTTFPFILEENPPHGQKNFVMLTLNTQLRRSTFFFLLTRLSYLVSAQYYSHKSQAFFPCYKIFQQPWIFHSILLFMEYVSTKQQFVHSLNFPQ